MFLLFIRVALIFIHALVINGCPISQTEYNSLSSLYESIGGGNWALPPDASPWSFSDGNLSAPCSGWYGLNCSSCLNATSNSIIGIELNSVNATGSLPTDIAGLSYLQCLNLPSNKLSGSVPSQLGQLLSLIEVNLASNKRLTGAIPTEVGLLTNLEQFNMYRTYLTGSIPTEIGYLTNLQQFNLFETTIRGTIPSEIGSLNRLQQFNMYAMEIQGVIPTEIGYLTDLMIFNTFDTYVSGTIPTEIGLLTNLHSLNMSRILINGTIPTEIGYLTNLQLFYMEDMPLTGTIPTEIGYLTQLQQINMGYMSLTGTIPTEIGYLTQLKLLFMDFMSLTGTIPTEIGYLTNLQLFYMEDMLLTGTIPTEIGYLTQLQQMYMGYMSLTGTIPTEIGHLTQLQQISIGYMSLTGTIPTELKDLISLEAIDLSYNMLSGTIPVNFWKLARLREISFSYNELTCSSTQGLSQLTGLTALGLANTNLIGTIPSDIWQLHLLAYLGLGSNRLSGIIPSEIILLSHLQELDLSDNSFNGGIPSEIWQLVEELNLSNNSLTGTIPSEIGALRYLGLSSNSLTGNIPSEIFHFRQFYVFACDNNQLSGTIPSQISSSIYLESLSLGFNSFTGYIPTEFCYLNEIYELELDNNRLIGSIPQCLAELTSLENLNLAANNLTGTVPKSWYHSSFLVELILYSNCLSGSIPQVSSLQYLDISMNRFHGSLPNSSNLRNLEYLDLSQNNFTGSFDSFLQELNGLNFFDASSNLFAGAINLTNLANLQTLIINNNSFSGPLTLNCSNSLQTLVAGSNQFSGGLSFLQCFQNLTTISLGDNKFNESLDFLSSLPIIQQVILNDNELTGTLPYALVDKSTLQVLFVQGNKLIGKPGSVFNSSTQTLLTAVDLSNNSFTGTIPYEPFLLPRLETFAASKNCFEGTLPLSICGCSSLKEILLNGVTSGPGCQKKFNLIKNSDAYVSLNGPVQSSIPECLWTLPLIDTIHLSSNGITGTIPELRIQSNLSSIVLSHNQLSGTIPLWLQGLNYTTLQLSSNRFKGTFSGPVSNKSVTLSLVNNRLSGFVPSSVETATNISILLGNYFDCDEKHPKPSADPNSAKVVCGSGQLNLSLLLWGTSLFALSTFVIVQLWSGGLGSAYFPEFLVKLSVEIQSVWKNRKSIDDSICYVLDIDPRSCFQIRAFAALLIHCCGVIVKSFILVTLFVCIPGYVALKFIDNKEYSIVTYQYQWLVSSVFLSGLSPAAFVLCCWLLLLVLMRMHIQTSGQVSSNSSHILHKTAWNILFVSRQTLLVLFHIGIIGVLNYVYLHVTLSSSFDVTVKTWIQLSTAFMKVIWDDALIPFFIRGDNSVTSKAYYGNAILKFWLLTLSMVVIPCLVSLLTNSLCLFDLFVPETYVSESFSYNIASQQSCILVKHPQFKVTKNDQLSNEVGNLPPKVVPTSVSVCVNYGSPQQFTSYFYPPFTYSFQCGSSILTSYVPVIVYVFAIKSAMLLSSFVFWSWYHRSARSVSSSNDNWFIWAVKCLVKYQFGPHCFPATATQIGDSLMLSTSLLGNLLVCLLLALTFGLASPAVSAIMALYAVLLLIAQLIFIGHYLRNSPRCKFQFEPTTPHPIVGPAGVVVPTAVLVDPSGGLDVACFELWRSVRLCVVTAVYISAFFWGLMLFDMVGDVNVHNPQTTPWLAAIFCAAILFHVSCIVGDRMMKLSGLQPEVDDGIPMMPIRRMISNIAVSSPLFLAPQPGVKNTVSFPAIEMSDEFDAP